MITNKDIYRVYRDERYNNYIETFPRRRHSVYISKEQLGGSSDLQRSKSLSGLSRDKSTKSLDKLSGE